jgi:uncharacterized repeat protein (TIGR03943 family)
MKSLTRQISFFAPAAVMTAWATVMLHTVASGRINELLSPLFRHYVILAAALLLAFSVLYLLLFQPTQKTSPAFAATGTLRQFGRWLVLLLPVIAAAVFSPSAFSSTTYHNRMVDPNNPSNQMPTWYQQGKQVPQAITEATDPSQAAPVDVTDLIQLGQHPDQARAFDGRKVRCVGHIIAGTGGGAPKLVRLIMWCCAADAVPATVDLHGDVKGPWKDDDWLEVDGTAEFPFKDGHLVPDIKVDTISPTQEPDEPYLSPNY